MKGTLYSELTSMGHGFVTSEASIALNPVAGVVCHRHRNPAHGDISCYSTSLCAHNMAMMPWSNQLARHQRYSIYCSSSQPELFCHPLSSLTCWANLTDRRCSLYLPQPAHHTPQDDPQPMQVPPSGLNSHLTMAIIIVWNAG